MHIHTGIDPTGVIGYGNPMLLENTAIKFPKLKILLEHYGYTWKNQAYAMCYKYENVYLTLAYHFNELVHNNLFLAWIEIEEMRIHAGLDKILYCSDFSASPNQKEESKFSMSWTFKAIEQLDMIPAFLRNSSISKKIIEQGSIIIVQIIKILRYIDKIKWWKIL